MYEGNKVFFERGYFILFVVVVVVAVVVVVCFCLVFRNSKGQTL